MRSCKRNGFTLVELLVALFVFSLLSAFSYRAVNQLLESRQSVTAESDALTAIQKTLMFWERDVRQSMLDSAAEGGQPSVLKVISDLSAGGSLHSVTGDIHYVMRGNTLYRDTYSSNQPDSIDQPPTSIALLSNVESFSINSLSDNAGTDQKVPEGVEMRIQHAAVQQIRRVIFTGVLLPDPGFSTLLSPKDPAGNPGGGNVDTEIPANY